MPKRKTGIPVPAKISVELIVWADHFRTISLPLDGEARHLQISIGFPLLENENVVKLVTTFKSSDDDDLSDPQAEVDTTTILKADIIHRKVLTEVEYAEIPH